MPEEIKKKKRNRRRKKKNNNKDINISQEQQEEKSHQCKNCDCKECNDENHECHCENCQKESKSKEPEYNEYDFMKLDTLEDKALFCQKLYKDIVECYNTLNHVKIRKTMDVINKYLLYTNEKDETLIDLEMVNMLKEISGYEVKPIWQKVTAGVGIKLHIGLEYKGMVFSLCRDFE